MYIIGKCLHYHNLINYNNEIKFNSRKTIEEKTVFKLDASSVIKSRKRREEKRPFCTRSNVIVTSSSYSIGWHSQFLRSIVKRALSHLF